MLTTDGTYAAATERSSTSNTRNSGGRATASALNSSSGFLRWTRTRSLVFQLARVGDAAGAATPRWVNESGSSGRPAVGSDRWRIRRPEGRMVAQAATQAGTEGPAVAAPTRHCRLSKPTQRSAFCFIG